MMMQNEPKVIVALDFDNLLPAVQFLDKVTPQMCRVKIGKSMYTRYGTLLLEHALRKGFDVFLDLKYHDIPKTVADAVEAAADHGVWMVNVHALGGLIMMQEALERLSPYGNRPLLIAVTVLTSLNQDDLQEMGIMHTPASLTGALMRTAYKAGLDGVVCSPHEVDVMRQDPLIDNNFLSVVPGIRPSGSDNGDQKRVMTPLDAINTGANYLVIGRPITQADDPVDVLRKINREISFNGQKK